jgi:hypothetical protein
MIDEKNQSQQISWHCPFNSSPEQYTAALKVTFNCLRFFIGGLLWWPKEPFCSPGSYFKFISNTKSISLRFMKYSSLCVDSVLARFQSALTQHTQSLIAHWSGVGNNLFKTSPKYPCRLSIRAVSLCLGSVRAKSHPAVTVTRLVKKCATGSVSSLYMFHIQRKLLVSAFDWYF